MNHLLRMNRLSACYRTSFYFVIVVLIMAMKAAALEYPLLKSQKQKKESKEQPPTLNQPERYLDKAIDPKTYVVGPGDVFVINLFGALPEPILTEILPEGVVSIPEVGEIKLGQVTLEEAKRRIAEGIMSRFRDRQVGVNLSRLRLFKVGVAGAVETPGVVVVSASDRVSDAVTLAGGLQKKASQRNLKLVNDGRDTVIADLAYFNATGQIDRDPYLHEGQVIFVPIVSDTFDKIEIYGAVNSPGVFEYRPGDRVSDLLALGFGPSTDADWNSAELLRFENGSTSKSVTVDLHAITTNLSSAENLALMPDDRLFVRAIAGYRLKEKVSISGEVKFPGSYPIQPGCRTLRELISKAGGLLTTASLSEAEMYRSSMFLEDDKSNFDQLLQLSTDKLTNFELQYLKERAARREGRVAVDFALLLEPNQPQRDIPLQDGDVIVIPAKSFSVTILGRVVNPGTVAFKENESIDYYVRLAGGYGYKANRGDIRLIKANTGSLVKPGRGTKVEMGDKIMVPQTKDSNVWGFVKDAGFFLANLATLYLVIDQAVK